jgi:hypothetical protein
MRTIICNSTICLASSRRGATFERELSPAAVGRKLAAMCENLARRSGNHARAGACAGRQLARARMAEY